MPISRHIIARTLPFAVFLLFLGLNDFFTGLISPSFGDARWLYGVRIALVILVICVFWKEYAELNTNYRLASHQIFISVLAGLFVLAVWVLPYPDWLKSESTSYFDPSLPNRAELDWYLVAMRWIGAALVVPLMEELFWRSFLMRWLQEEKFLSVNPRHVRLFAFVTTACLFAVEHSLWLAGLIAGLVYGALYRYYGNLCSPIISHSVTNGLLGAWIVHTSNWRYW